MRAQANLPALAVALIVLTATTGLGLALAETAFTSATRAPSERRAAIATAERLVAPDGPLTVRRNVLDRDRASNLTAATLDRDYPVVRGRAVRIRLGGRTLVERGDPAGGTTVRRIVLVATRQRVTRRPPLPTNATTIPRRTSRLDLAINPPPGTTVRTVRTNGRVVLRNGTGLDGEYTVRVSRFETVELRFETDGPLPQGSVAVTYVPERTRKATLAVTVDA
ncbi:MAG: hypothetical protein ABEJ82_02025 [Haloplanus sp.]